MNRQRIFPARERVFSNPYSAAEALEPRRLFAAYALTDLGSLGGRYGEAVDLNNKGQAVINVDVNPDPQVDEIHPFLFDGQTRRDLGTLSGSSTYARAINASGQIVGAEFSPDPNVNSHAFLYDGNLMIDLTTRTGGRLDNAFGINDRGDVTGVGLDAQGQYYRGVVYTGGVVTPFGPVGSTGPRDINAKGQITGTADSQAFVYDAGRVKQLGTFGGDLADVNAINDAGHLAGYVERFNGDDGPITFAAFTYADGKEAEIGTLPGLVNSNALDVNNSDLVVGYGFPDGATGTPAADRAFVYAGGVMQDLNALADLPAGATLTSAVAVNAGGQILATGYVDGVPHAYLLTPAAAGSVSGSFYTDANQNGVRDDGEPPVVGWMAYADQDDDGKLDPNEPFATSGADGSYTISNLPTGKYRIRELRQDGYTRTQPAGVYPLGYYDLTLAAGQAVTGKVFGNILPAGLPPPNVPPTAQPDAADTAAGSPVEIDVLANDTDDSGLVPGTVTIHAAPASGTTAVDLTTGRVTYTPAAGFAGTDSFTYTVNDDAGAASAPATVTVTVVAPVAETPPPLTPVVTATLPASAVGGAKVKGSVAVQITNSTSQPVAGPVTIGLFVSADAVLDGGDPAAAAVTKKLKLAPGQSKVMKVKLSRLPRVGTDGSYRLLARVTAPGGEAGVAAAPAPVTIAAPAVDLTAAFASAPAGDISRGRPAAGVLRIENAGNSPVNKLVTVALYASADPSLTDASRPVATIPVKLNLPAGKGKTVRVKFTPPADLSAGSYYLLAAVDSANQVVEVNEGNNLAASASPFTLA